MYILGYPLQALGHILGTILFLYTIIIIVSAIISWVRLDPWHPIVRLLNQLTNPVYQRIRPHLPRTGRVDLAPIIALLAIMFIQQGLLPVLMRFARHLIVAD